MDGIQLLLQVVSRRISTLLVDNKKHHVFAEQLAAHADVDGSFLSVASQNPDLDAGLLEGVDRLWDAVLQPIFDGRGAEEVKVLLDELGGLVQLFSTITTDGRLRLVVDLIPLLELVLRDLAHG